MEKREDLRHLTVCSVDPPGCTDIDDALHCRELKNGNLEVRIFYTYIISTSSEFSVSVLNVSVLACDLFSVDWGPHC